MDSGANGDGEKWLISIALIMVHIHVNTNLIGKAQNPRPQWR